MTTLADLPDELLQQVADLLDRKSQKSLALVSPKAWDVATNAIWRDVKLIDRLCHYRCTEEEEHILPIAKNGIATDEHDDLPIIRKLFALAKNKRLALKVRIVTHRCHLPLPAIFQDLPRMAFENHPLSADWRTVQLALLAAKNMENVRTVRLLNGHYNLVSALLNGFYGPTRKHVPPHLWMESCSLHGFPLRMDNLPQARNGLKSVRFRRMRLQKGFSSQRRDLSYSRIGHQYSLHDGRGGTYETTIGDDPYDRDEGMSWTFKRPLSNATMLSIPDALRWLNNKTYEQVPGVQSFLGSDEPHIDLCSMMHGSPRALHQQRDRLDDTISVIARLNAHTLRSINLDWLLVPSKQDDRCSQYALFQTLSLLHFPHLRAFQLRNAVTENTLLSDHIYLLQPYTHVPPPESPRPFEIIASSSWKPLKSEYRIDMLSFMERHPNLECLAWPMDRFYAALLPYEQDRKINDRASAVVSNLGRTLNNLRTDFYYTSRGEPQTDDETSTIAKEARIRRRRFISEFASHMTKLTVLKMEGGIPRDEKRETMAATSRCPIEKCVMIAVSCPLGNTWGVNGQELADMDDGHLQFHGLLEAEPEEALLESTKQPFFPGDALSRKDAKYRAEYGWPPGPSMLYHIALHHASTITELKFCGYNGSPILHKPTEITKSLLHHLRHFHKLKKIVMSFWLLTFFEFDWREMEIIEYWLDQRESTSTALVTVPQPQPTQPVPNNVAPAEVLTWAAIVAGNTGSATHSNATDADGDVSMSQTPALQPFGDADWGPTTVGALSALTGNVDGADDATMNPDIMMAAALGTGALLASPGVHGLSAEAAANDMDMMNITVTGTTTHASTDVVSPIAGGVELTIDAEDFHLEEEDPNPWETALTTKFSPHGLSRGVSDIITPHLSPQARAKGVNIRASFCLGVESGDIFDLDFVVDNRRGAVVESSIVGPREEAEKERWWGKLEGRGWFG